MSDDDFGGSPKTVFIPNPGGRRAPAPPPPGPGPAADFGAAPARGGGPAFGAADTNSGRPGVNPLVDAAAPLFDLVVYLRGQATALDADDLRGKIMALMKTFERSATAAGEEQKVVSVARYAISATIDDVILSLPWGFECGWHDNTLVSQLHEEVIGGDRFFELLDTARKDQNRFRNLIELKYICLSLGFQGRYRRGQESHAQLDQIRTGVFTTVNDARGGLQERLSLRWKGTETERKPIRDLIPMWLAGAVGLGLSALLFFVAVTFVGDASATAIDAVQKQAGKGTSKIVHYDPPAPKVEVVVQVDAVEEVSLFLQPEIEEGLLEFFEQGGNLRIRIVSEVQGQKAMFGSGKAVLRDNYFEVVQRIALALNEKDGPVLVEGHSDSDKIRTAKFPSNYHLSKARAQAVMDFMLQYVNDPNRLEAEGQADNFPLVPNDNRANKAKNRRVEIVLLQSS